MAAGTVTNLICRVLFVWRRTFDDNDRAASRPVNLGYIIDHEWDVC